MAVKSEDIKRWLIEAKRMKATHLIIACDSFDYDNYPVYLKEGQSVELEIKRLKGQDMTRIDEVYSMRRDLNEQLAEDRAWHTD